MRTVIRSFPLPRIQCGAMSGNGKIGVLIWGEKRILQLTVGVGDLWDHRGGMPWDPGQEFTKLRKILQNNDEPALRKMFARSNAKEGVPCPALIPLGRLTLILPRGYVLDRFEQPLAAGTTRIICRRAGKETVIEFCCDMSCRYAFFARGIPQGTQGKITSGFELTENFPPSDFTGQTSLRTRGFLPPQKQQGKGSFAFLQKMPADPSVALLVRFSGNEIATAVFRGKETLSSVLEEKLPRFQAVLRASRQWWKRFWHSVPVLHFDHEEMEELYWHGMYKYAIMTNPAGVRPGLQGPWLEDDRVPPWSGDYHFNINAQMCNSPGLRAGCYGHLKPFFDMILSWKEKLRYNASCFTGIENGYMLPHAVDDRCTCMGAFWTGCIDQACTAWVAQMMFDYCDYSGDLNYLKDEVYDFMRGALAVFEKMIDRDPDGSLSLPVSISPEYRGDNMDAWGKNSSFQLAAIHRLARNLIQAANLLGISPEPFALEVEKKLPVASFCDTENGKVIALWENLPLRESHRHHSHLGGLVPFGVIDPEAPETKEIVRNTIFNWTLSGMGGWTGWCIPWASRIYTRIGNADMAVISLEMWKHCFTNQGGASLHDAPFQCFSIFGDLRGEIMQMDGAMGAVTALQEIFAYSQDSTLHFFKGVPPLWKRASFRGLHCSGGILAAGSFSLGRTRTLHLQAARDAAVQVCTADAPEKISLSLKAGECADFTVRHGQLIRMK